MVDEEESHFEGKVKTILTGCCVVWLVVDITINFVSCVFYQPFV